MYMYVVDMSKAPWRTMPGVEEFDTITNVFLFNVLLKSDCTTTNQ
jgi:hypothetical protein